MDKQFIGKAIRKTRRAMDMKQEDLALHVGCSPSYFSELENGKHYFKLELLEKIGTALNMDYREFLPPPPPVKLISMLAQERISSVENLPLKLADNKTQKKIKTIVDQILTRNRKTILRTQQTWKIKWTHYTNS